MIGTKNAYHLLILVDGFVLLLAEGVKSLYSNITVILSQFQYFAVFAVIFDEFINKNELYDELIKTVIILLKGEAVFPLRCVSICPLLQQINQP